MRDLVDSTYVPGSWVAISAVHGCLLVDMPAEDPIVRRCWKLLADDAGADAVLDALVGGGIAATPAFALVLWQDAAVRVVVRRTSTVELHPRDGDGRVISADPLVSWTDVVIDVDRGESLDGLVLRGRDTTSTVELPMGMGVTMAAVVLLRPGTPVRASVDELQRAEFEPTPEPPVEDVPHEESVPAPAPAPLPAPAPAIATTTTPEDDASATAPDDSYDHLFGASTRRPKPELLGPDEYPAPTHHEPTISHTQGWVTGATPLAALPPDVSSDDGAEDLIEDVPWARPAADSLPQAPVQLTPTVVVSSPLPEPDEGRSAPSSSVPDAPPGPQGEATATLNRSQIAAVLAATGGPTVLAGRCGNGHLSPPYADRCRVCRAPIPDQEAFEIARPHLGVLRLPSGDAVTLDRGVVLGRQPDVPTGADRPHVVRLHSPENDISRNHAEIVLDGWNVYIRDLGSTNGTVLELPGQAPFRVREKELNLLEPGTRIVLAYESTIVFEVSE